MNNNRKMTHDEIWEVIDKMSAEAGGPLSSAIGEMLNGFANMVLAKVLPDMIHDEELLNQWQNVIPIRFLFVWLYGEMGQCIAQDDNGQMEEMMEMIIERTKNEKW